VSREHQPASASSSDAFRKGGAQERSHSFGRIDYGTDTETRVLIAVEERPREKERRNSPKEFTIINRKRSQRTPCSLRVRSPKPRGVPVYHSGAPAFMASCRDASSPERFQSIPFAWNLAHPSRPDATVTRSCRGESFL